jgi:hypothetical protein
VGAPGLDFETWESMQPYADQAVRFARPEVTVAHIHRDAPHTLQQVIGDRRQLLRRHTKRRTGDAHRSDRLTLRIQKRNGNAAQPFFKFLVVHGVPAAPRLFHLRAQSLREAIVRCVKALKARSAAPLRQPDLPAEMPASPSPPTCNAPDCWPRSA